VNYPLLVFNQLSIELFTIQSIFRYFDVAIDIMTAIREWVRLDYRNLIGWMHAGIFTGKSVINALLTTYMVINECYQTVVAVVPKSS
jgi:hypothetical protein